ncbi:MAG: dihydroxyacetone kinase ADP-binding subunit DhaL [Desulfobacteraceae bacterium]|nr:dihydroxyacetone kinase ADP-binding subunit DhaL [Desulfobacteraceae bacterium]
MTISKEQLITWLDNTAGVMQEKREYLTELDAAIGDADHGINMDRGFSKVKEKLPTVADKDLGTIFKTVGMTLMSSVGGASGPLYGTFFMKAGMALMGKEALAAEDFLTFVENGVGGILQRGRAEVGDKTMYDVWAPVLEGIKGGVEAGKTAPELSADAVVVAEKALEGTIPLQAKKGRASYLGERSIGHQDPGATSSTLMLKALLNVIA